MTRYLYERLDATSPLLSRLAPLSTCPFLGLLLSCATVPGLAALGVAMGKKGGLVCVAAMLMVHMVSEGRGLGKRREAMWSRRGMRRENIEEVEAKAFSS